MPHDTCTVAECDKPIKRRALCYGHYMKAWRYGTPTPTFDPKYADLKGRTFGELTVTQRHGKAWLCACSCGTQSVVRTGDLNRGSAQTCGDRATHRRSDDIGYATAHDRVRRDRGRIASHSCVDCGGRAQHWSYDHEDPDQMFAMNISANPVAYSNKPEHYEPRCVSCHKRFDLGRTDSASARA